MSTTHPLPSNEIPAPTLEEVSDGIFAYVQLDGSWGLNNAGFFVGRQAHVWPSRSAKIPASVESPM